MVVLGKPDMPVKHSVFSDLLVTTLTVIMDMVGTILATPTSKQTATIMLWVALLCRQAYHIPRS
ncbi:hypothetical protein C0J52_17123 [Blattella germanica]|nr:hypothetical protein C0J52_17123 [Blattella germanica]